MKRDYCFIPTPLPLLQSLMHLFNPFYYAIFYKISFSLHILFAILCYFMVEFTRSINIAALTFMLWFMKNFIIYNSFYCVLYIVYFILYIVYCLNPFNQYRQHKTLNLHGLHGFHIEKGLYRLRTT